jgi:hypothetical protein
MQKLEAILRLLLFVICSAVGILSISLATLGQEWKSLYDTKAAVIQTERNNVKIEQIIKDHEVLTGQIATDPNILAKLAPLTLGSDVNDPNERRANITAEMLDRAKAVLNSQDDAGSLPQPPIWLQRSTTGENRVILFVCGAGLVLVSFACFGKMKKNKKVES